MQYLQRINLSLFILMISVMVCSAQIQFKDNDPITCGKYRILHSNVLNEDRILLVRVPDDYGKTDKKYPVIYKLDGEKDVFLQTYSAAYYIFDWIKNTPDAIIVGIRNTDRNRDMGPDHKADSFIQFIETELIPFVETNYRTNGFRIIAGQSYSSVFALYSFLKKPALFNAYILSSFGLYNESLASLFESEMKKNRDLKTVGNKYIYVAQGKHDAYDPDGSITKRGAIFLETLQQTVHSSVLLKSKCYEDEGHVPFPSLYDGFKWIYSCDSTSAKY